MNFRISKSKISTNHKISKDLCKLFIGIQSARLLKSIVRMILFWTAWTFCKRLFVAITHARISYLRCELAKLQHSLTSVFLFTYCLILDRILAASASLFATWYICSFQVKIDAMVQWFESALQSVDLEFTPFVGSYQKTLNKGIHSFPAWRSAFWEGCGEQAGKLACFVVGQGT